MHSTHLFETQRLHIIRLQPIGTPVHDCDDPVYTEAMYPGHEPLCGVVRAQRSGVAARRDGVTLYRTQFRLLSDLPFEFDRLRLLGRFDAYEQKNVITAAHSTETGRIRLADRADIMIAHAIRGRGVGGYLLACTIALLAERHPGCIVASLKLSSVDSPTAFQRAIRNGLYSGRGFECVPTPVPGFEQTVEASIDRLLPRWNEAKVEIVDRDRIDSDPAFAAIRQPALAALDQDGEPTGHCSDGWSPPGRWV